MFNFEGFETITIRFAVKFYLRLVITFLPVQIVNFRFWPQLGFYEYEYKPFRGRNIVSGRRDYHHSICREILPRIGGLTFLLAEILNFSFLAQIWPFRGLNMNIV